MGVIENLRAIARDLDHPVLTESLQEPERNRCQETRRGHWIRNVQPVDWMYGNRRRVETRKARGSAAD